MKDNNKLIAEFMGGEKPERTSDLRHFIEEHHNYHTSWDWLMPVIEKIENDGLDPHGMIDNSLRKNNQKRWRSIEDTHNVAVYLINIYNNEQ
jgi:hypothetical protein